MRKFHLHIFFVFFCLCCTYAVQSQTPDARFSQFYAAPLQLNPAMNGVFDGTWRTVINYRDQWASVLDKQSFRTVAASFDYRHNIVGDDYLASIIAKNFSVYAGGAVNHVNSPNITFLGDQSETAERRWVAHAGAQIPLNDQLSILPAMVAQIQGPSRSYTFGSNIRYSNGDWREVAIRFGVWGHIANKLETSLQNDALIFNLTLEYDAFQFGISYDINTSSLVTASNSRGAYELSLMYSTPSKDRRAKVTCPQF